MAIAFEYALPVEASGWLIAGRAETRLDWRYDAPSEKLLALYDKGKQAQWDAARALPWEAEIDPDNPLSMVDQATALYGSEVWRRMTPAERSTLRRHQQAFLLSQFLHGEQAALVASARIVQVAPDLDAKLFAATQAMDEARHVEAYRRLLVEKLGVTYPITPGLRALIESGLSDSRWDIVYLTTQVLIEGLALAALHSLRPMMRHPLAAAIHEMVLQDESRHVAFGRSALRAFYAGLGEAERAERAGFAAEAIAVLRDRFDQREMFERLGLPVAACIRVVEAAPAMRMFRRTLSTWLTKAIADVLGLTAAERGGPSR